MQTKRIVVCLDVRDGKTTKGIKFQNNVDIGDPVEMAILYSNQGVDELVFYDITASSEKRNIMLDVVKNVAANITVPFCVGGGIGTIEDIQNIIKVGANKVSINSLAVRNPQILKDGAKHFGSQAIALGVDAKKDASMPSGYRVVINGGRVETDLDVVEWALKAQDLGAGEVVLNSIDADGMKTGYELDLTRIVSEAVNIPVVASGGAGKPEHLFDVFNQTNADAALVASMVHYGDYTVENIKSYLKERNISVKM